MLYTINTTASIIYKNIFSATVLRILSHNEKEILKEKKLLELEMIYFSLHIS